MKETGIIVCVDSQQNHQRSLMKVLQSCRTPKCDASPLELLPKDYFPNASCIRFRTSTKNVKTFRDGILHNKQKRNMISRPFYHHMCVHDERLDFTQLFTTVACSIVPWWLLSYLYHLFCRRTIQKGFVLCSSASFSIDKQSTFEKEQLLKVLFKSFFLSKS